MNVIEIMTSINKYGRYFIILVVLANLVSVAFAAETNIRDALSQLCNYATLFLSAAVIIMIILAGAIYAIGQMLGAETRARASVWATAMLTGAIIGAIIYLITPYVLQTLLGGGMIDPENPCDFGNGGGGGIPERPRPVFP